MVPQDIAVLTTLADRKKAAAREMELEEGLEGCDDDANHTKVVDRRWYEKNKHIFPASTWEEFDPEKDYSKAIRRDAGGNAFFFS
jgi:protein FAM50